MAALVAGLGAAAAATVPSAFVGRVAVDEPQYLLTALSLAEDGDLDISDELDAQRWRAWHEGDLPQQTQPRTDGSRVSPHDPGLPLLLAGPTRIAGWVGARAVMVVLAVLLAAATVRVAVRQLGVSPGLAAAGAGLAGASAPLALYGAQTYPELPAALVVLVTAGAVLRLGDAGSPPTASSWGVRWSVVAAGLGVVSLPWLSVKYAPVAAALAVVLLARLVPRSRRATVCLLLGWGVAGAAYLGLHQLWYGGWTVYASGDHFVATGEFSVVGTDADYVGRTSRLVGLLLDRDFGLLAWQPAWLALVPALAWLVRRRPPSWDVMALPLAAGWATATWVALTMHGYWFPGRQVVVVLPLGLLAVLLHLQRLRERGARVWPRAVAVLAASGVLTLLLLVRDADAGILTAVSGLDRLRDPLHQSWRSLLPDYRWLTSGAWVRHGIGLAVLVAAAGAGWRSGRDEAPDVPLKTERVAVRT